MIVRWGLDALPDVLEELSVSDTLVISTERWRSLELPVTRRFHGAQAHAEATGVKQATAAAAGADGLIALGGGSVLSGRVREALRSHVVVLLDVSPEEAWRRVTAQNGGATRPLARLQDGIPSTLSAIGRLRSAWSGNR